MTNLRALPARRLAAAELVAAVTAAALIAWVDWRIALSAGVALGLLVCVVTFRGLAGWQWAWLALRWVRRREHRLTLPDPFDVMIDGEPIGVIVQ